MDFQSKDFKSREDQIIFDHRIASIRLLEDIKHHLDVFDREHTLEYIEALIASMKGA